MGLGYDGIAILVHKNYSAFLEFRSFLREYTFLENDVDSFLIDLSDRRRYLPLTMALLGQHLRTTAEAQEK